MLYSPKRLPLSKSTIWWSGASTITGIGGVPTEDGAGFFGQGFKGSISDVSVGVSLTMTLVFLAICMAIVWWMFRTGYKIKK